MGSLSNPCAQDREIPGETVLFRIDKTAGSEHNFYIGTEEELADPDAVTPVGIPTWFSGVRELAWTVPDDISGLRFGCTVPGHIFTESGPSSGRWRSIAKTFGFLPAEE